MRALILALLLAACGGEYEQTAQTIITNVAELTLVDTQDLRVQYHESRDEQCRVRFPPAEHPFSAWMDCMTPSYRLDRVVTTLDGALRVAQAALDASGEEGFRAKVPDLVAAATIVLSTMIDLGLDPPDEIRTILNLADLLA